MFGVVQLALDQPNPVTAVTAWQHCTSTGQGIGHRAGVSTDTQTALRSLQREGQPKSQEWCGRAEVRQLWVYGKTRRGGDGGGGSAVHATIGPALETSSGTD